MISTWSKGVRLSCVVGALLCGSGVTSAFSAILTNSDGGDGYVITTKTGYQLFGSDNESGFNTTSYTSVADTAETLSFRYTYTTYDDKDPFWDPAGYIINGVTTQLTAENVGVPYSVSGTVSFKLAADDVFGFYVTTYDGTGGRGAIEVSSVPLPSSASLLGLALLGLAAAGVGMDRRSASRTASHVEP